MDNYPDNVRYEGDTQDPRSPFYEGEECDGCCPSDCEFCGEEVDEDE